MVRRRTVLRVTAAVGTGSLVAGCAGGPEETDGPRNGTETTTAPATTRTTTEAAVTEVAVGPERRLRFVPEEITIPVGERVIWTAESQGHNVTSKPGAAPRCTNPEGAEPFASYEGTNHSAIMAVGETFEHQFTVPGEYVYVCAPHAGQGMYGFITVTGAD